MQQKIEKLEQQVENLKHCNQNVLFNNEQLVERVEKVETENARLLVKMVNEMEISRQKSMEIMTEQSEVNKISRKRLKRSEAKFRLKNKKFKIFGAKIRFALLA